MLLECPGEVVTREEMRARLWPAETFVDSDHGLNSAVRRLRDALGDSAENPRYVETLERRGYRFIFPIERNAASTRQRDVEHARPTATVIPISVAREPDTDDAATVGSTDFPISLNPTVLLPKSPIGRGSPQRSTKSSTKRHASGRRSRRRRDSTGKRNNCTTLSYSLSIPDCGPTKHGAFSSGMSRWLTTKIWARQSWRLKYAESAACCS